MLRRDSFCGFDSLYALVERADEFAGQNPLIENLNN
jgi:hypothetical protein